LAIPLEPAEAGATILEETIDADTATRTASPITNFRALMVLPFLSLCSDESADRSRGTPRSAARREIVRRPAASPSSRASTVGSAGKEAVLASGGVVTNAA
jgi:hypothetical protein